MTVLESNRKQWRARLESMEIKSPSELMREILRETVIKPIVAQLFSTQKVPGKIDYRRLRRQLRKMARSRW